MSKKNILFIRGIPDNRNVQVKAIDENERHSLIYSGSSNLFDHLNSDLLDKKIINLDANSQQQIRLGDFDAVFNQISDADTHKITLLKAENIYKILPQKTKTFNLPSNIRKTARDHIYDLLQDIKNLHVPKTVRIQPTSPSDIYTAIEEEGFEFPVIFRQAGDHGGISTVLIENNNEPFYAFALDGRDYYLTQFVNYLKDGIYTKYRLIVVEGEVFLRHVMFSHNWMVHDKNQLQEIDLRKNISNRFNKEIKTFIQPIITEIYHRLNLDYFGIDCHIDKDMNILIFEINANMNIFAYAETTVFKDHLDNIHDALVNMLTTSRE